MRIPLDRFEQVIDEKILERGLEYFRRGAVEEPVEVESGLYEAVVSGTEDYTVRVRVQGNAITEHTCACPYDLGPVCKHVAAVLFHLKKDELGLKAGKRKSKAPAKKKTVADQVASILSSLDRADVDRFITQRSAEDRAFRAAFLAEFAHLGEGRSKATYAAQLKSLLRGKDHWGLARPLAATAGKLLERAQKHQRDEQHEPAFLIACALAEELVRALNSVDDSSGLIGPLINEAFALMDALASVPTMRDAVVGYCVGVAEKKLFDGWDWHHTAMQVAAQHAQDKEHRQRLRTLLDEALEEEPTSGWTAGIMHTLLLRTDGPQAAHSFLLEHAHITAVREQLIADAIGAKQFDEAERLTSEAIAKDEARQQQSPLQHNSAYVSNWTKQLLDIAMARGDTADIAEHARAIFLFGFQVDREAMYDLLMQHTPASDRQSVADQLIHAVKTRTRYFDFAHLALILVREERWSELVAALKSSTHYEVIQEYGALLPTSYHAELAIIYADAIRLNLQRTANRGTYQQAARTIRRIIKLGERDLAETLIEELRTAYPQRAALMDELDKV